MLELNHYHPFLADIDNSQNQQRKINHKNTHHSRQQIIKQFLHLARIGSYKIQKHIYRYHSRPEEIKQYQLEGSEKNKKKSPPDHLTRASG